jgi:hypothetical protein
MPAGLGAGLLLIAAQNNVTLYTSRTGSGGLGSWLLFAAHQNNVTVGPPPPVPQPPAFICPYEPALTLVGGWVYEASQSTSPQLEAPALAAVGTPSIASSAGVAAASDAAMTPGAASSNANQDASHASGAIVVVYSAAGGVFVTQEVSVTSNPAELTSVAAPGSTDLADCK